MNRSRVQSGKEVPGGRQQAVDTRKFSLFAKDFTQVEQGNPVPVGFGTFRVSGVQITPIFNFRSKKIKTSQGK